MAKCEEILNSQVLVEITKKLTSPMAFLIVMAFVSYGGLYFVKSYISPIGFEICIYVWFGSMITVTCLAFFILLWEAKRKYLMQEEIVE